MVWLYLFTYRGRSVFTEASTIKHYVIYVTLMFHQLIDSTGLKAGVVQGKGQ